MTTKITFVTGACIRLDGLPEHHLRWSPKTGFSVFDWGTGGMVKIGEKEIYLGGRKNPVTGKQICEDLIKEIEFITPTRPGGEHRG